MKYLIDIGHPGHVHLFKYMIIELKKKGHEILITARDKEVTLRLLDKLGFQYFNRGKGYNGILFKIVGIFLIDYKIIRQALMFNPDILIGGVGNIYIVTVAKIMNRPSIIFDDTEHSLLELSLIKHLASCILTPDVYSKNLGKHQIRYSGLHELAYLHPKYFSPDKTTHTNLNICYTDKYFLLRFVSWKASHDIGHNGLTMNEKRELVEFLKNYGKVFISSESILDDELEPYRLNISPESIHSVLAFASLIISEGATMASESAVLGTPVIYVNSLQLGYCIDQEKYGLLFHFKSGDGVLDTVRKILADLENNKNTLNTRKLYLKSKIDVSAFFVWFVENYPASYEIMKMNPNYQYNFK